MRRSSASEFEIVGFSSWQMITQGFFVGACRR